MNSLDTILNRINEHIMSDSDVRCLIKEWWFHGSAVKLLEGSVPFDKSDISDIDILVVVKSDKSFVMKKIYKNVHILIRDIGIYVDITVVLAENFQRWNSEFFRNVLQTGKRFEV